MYLLLYIQAAAAKEKMEMDDEERRSKFPWC